MYKRQLLEIVITSGFSSDTLHSYIPVSYTHLFCFEAVKYVSVSSNSTTKCSLQTLSMTWYGNCECLWVCSILETECSEVGQERMTFWTAEIKESADHLIKQITVEVEGLTQCREDIETGQEQIKKELYCLTTKEVMPSWRKCYCLYLR